MTSSTRRLRTIDLVLLPMFVALMAIGANISAFLVIGGVPITLQTFFAVLAGALLGSRLGAFSMLLYLFVGLIGAPIFAQFSGGLSTLVSPTLGFILSFILVAFATGKIIEKSNQKTLQTFLVASFVGLFINYIIGTNYMYIAYVTIAQAPEGFTYGMAWAWMLAPLVKDIIVVSLAAIAAKRIYVTVATRAPQTLKAS